MTWRNAKGTAAVLITGAGVVLALSLLFLGMRSVMDIGGSCGSVGTPACPAKATFVFVGIWGGLICPGLYVWACPHDSVPSLVSLLWPALFISLGYNFFDYGFKNSNIEAGFIVCGVVFVLMGGVPLVYALPHLWRVYAKGDIEAAKPFHVRTTATAVNSIKQLTSLSRKQNMTEQLDDLADLHKTGQLSDFEYAKAKDKVIREGSTTT